MMYSAITLPSTILCGKCGFHMRADGSFHLGKQVIVRCYSTQCEHYDIPLIFPLVPIELQKAEANEA